MRRYAVVTLAVTAIFLLIVGVFLRTPSLFFMSTTMIMTLLALRVQAHVATLGLRFERIAPHTMKAGELVTMRIRVWSTLRIRRPLLTIVDVIPPKLPADLDMRPLPVAPDADAPIETRYELRPARRGVYRWSAIRVSSSDSLGLVWVNRTYRTEEFEAIVHPALYPFSVDLLSLSGFGANQSDQGRNRGQGMEPRGVREFVHGDALRTVHWRSTARTGKLQVKEFETGYNTQIAVLIQLTYGSDVGVDANTTLEAMCGHVAFLAEVMLNAGSTIRLANIEPPDFPAAHSAALRKKQILDALAAVEATRTVPLSSELAELEKQIETGQTVVVLLSTAEKEVPEAIRRISARAGVVVMVYNPRDFLPPGATLRGTPATDPDFLAQLAAPGVRIQLMENPHGSFR
jgi:uncharacterized protein (DUF58 family)